MWQNFSDCVKELSFTEIAAKLSEFRRSMDFKEVKAEDIAGLEEKVQHCQDEIAMLQGKVTQLSTDFGRLVGEVSALRSAAAGIQTLSEEVSVLKTQIGQKLEEEMRHCEFEIAILQSELSINFGRLVGEVSALRSAAAGIQTLSTEVSALKAQIAAMSPDLTVLRNKVTQLSTDFGRLVSEVSALRSAAAGIQTLSEEVSALKTQIAQKLNDPVVEQLSEKQNCSDITRTIVRFADHFRLSGDLHRVPRGPNFASVAGQSRWFRSKRISPPM
jgi:chromosome segregation ATPase